MFWVKKMGAPDFGKGGYKVEEKHFIKVPIPQALREKAIKYTKTYKYTLFDRMKAWKEVVQHPQPSQP